MQDGMREIINASVESIKGITDADTVIGQPIHTPAGVTVIPVSKISLGFASGGFDTKIKRGDGNAPLGGGSGSGVSITPVAFLTVSSNADINIVYISDKSEEKIDKLSSIIEKSPSILQRIKDVFT
ncbi:MAG: sporulation protein YtfJ [Clostridia bacterium]|nr:sporulation protein YtfJ [Clostridia bacterium]